MPDDVVTLLAGPAVEQVHADVAEAARQDGSVGGQSRALTGIGPAVPDFSGDVTAGPAHLVSSFTDEFVAGDPDAEPATSKGAWLAALVRDGEALGTVLV